MAGRGSWCQDGTGLGFRPAPDSVILYRHLPLDYHRVYVEATTSREIRALRQRMRV
jgi:hypothetical protein